MYFSLTETSDWIDLIHSRIFDILFSAVSSRLCFSGWRACKSSDYLLGLPCKQSLLIQCDSLLGQRRVDGLVKTYYGTRLLGYLFRLNGSGEAIFYLGIKGKPCPVPYPDSKCFVGNWRVQHSPRERSEILFWSHDNTSKRKPEFLVK